MRPAPFLAALLVVVTAGSAQPVVAQPFNGSYTASSEDGLLRLVIREMGNGRVTGSLFGNGVTYTVDGRIEEGVASGSLRGPAGLLFFEAEPWEDELLVMLFESDGYGRPNYDDFTELDFILSDDAVGMLLPGGNPLGGGGPDPYVGTFSDGNVMLRLERSGGQYAGQVQVQGVMYPVQAQAGVNGIQGTIQAPDGAYAIAAQAQGPGLLVVSGGQRYSLTRIANQALVPPGVNLLPGAQAGPRHEGPIARPGGPGGVPPGRASRPGSQEDDALALQWVQFLSGRKLTSADAYSSRRPGGSGPGPDVYLCSNRSYGLLAGGRGGRWQVLSDGQVTNLVLEGSDGTVTEFLMEFLDEDTYANGHRVSVAPAEVCR